VSEVSASQQLLLYRDRALEESLAHSGLTQLLDDPEEPVILVNMDEAEEESSSFRSLGEFHVGNITDFLIHCTYTFCQKPVGQDTLTFREHLA